MPGYINSSNLLMMHALAEGFEVLVPSHLFNILGEFKVEQDTYDQACFTRGCHCAVSHDRA